MTTYSVNDALALASRDLLMRGDPVGAEKILSPVLRELRADAAVLHLMGQIKRAQNKMEEAEIHFRSAIAGSLSEGTYYNDLGQLLQARGAYTEAVRVFRAAIALMPEAGAMRVNLVRCLMAAGEPKQAEREARAYVRAIPSADSWTLLGHVQRSLERFDEALASAEEALKLAPTMRGVRHNYAIALDRVGRADAALKQFEALASETIDSPELAINLARALHLEERLDEAEHVLETALAAWQGDVKLHSALARMRWLRGAGDKATAVIEDAMKARPDDLALRLVCADLLRRADNHQKARRMLEEGLALAPDSPTFQSSLGIVLDEMGMVDAGLVLLRAAAEKAPNAPHTLRNLIETLMRAGHPDEALKLVREIQIESPDDQQLIAHEAIAMRMLGQRGYKDLYDYERYVKVYDLAPPRGHFSAANFNASLAESLRAHHRSAAHPLDQSLRNGSQTGRSLLEVDDVNIKAFLEALHAPIKAYTSAIDGDANHPLVRRRRRAYRFSGCWSVKLKPGGYHVPHVHQTGWISSVYYVDVPEDMGPDRAGWLKFGEPRLPTPGCTPDMFVQPKTGLLVLFPSYMWHGTAPFTKGEERLSVSFDVVPG